MKLFRDYTMTWWQVGLLKTYVAVIGLIVGAYYAEIVSQYYTVLIGIFVVLMVYFLYMMVSDGFAGKASAETPGEWNSPS